MDLPPAPRQIKYAWALLMTLLVSASFALQEDSQWLPLVHRTIDILQQMAPVIPSKSDTNPSLVPLPPTEAES